MKRILFITLAVLLSTLSAYAYAYDFKVDGIAYRYIYINGSARSVYVTSGGDKNISHLNIPSRVTYNGYTLRVTNIGDKAFENYTNIKSVTIGNHVTSIGDCAFSGCTGLTSVTIPNSVTTIGTAAFSGCTGLTSVIIGNSITIPNPVTTIGYAAFSDCPSLTSVTIGNSVTEIGTFAFSGCTGLTSVTIGNSVTEIGENAFDGCAGLTSVTIPNSVTSIGDYAFYYCTGLTSVTIGNSVTLIGYRTFWDCTGLKKIYSLNPEPPEFKAISAFDSYNKNLFVPKGCVSKYKTARFWRNFKFISEIEEEGGIDDVVGADSKINYDGGTIAISVPSEIAVYSIDGKLVATANGVSLDTESLTRGTYVVRAVDAHGNVQTLKFIK